MMKQVFTTYGIGLLLICLQLYAQLLWFVANSKFTRGSEIIFISHLITCLLGKSGTRVVLGRLVGLSIW